MKMIKEIGSSRASSAALAAAGILLLIAGVIASSDGHEAIAGSCFGLGAAATALGIGRILMMSFQSEEDIEEVERRKKIEVEDERNIGIRDRAGSSVNRITTYLLCILIIGASLLGADLAVILMLIVLLAVRFILLVAYHDHYARTT
ncbi:MAG: hypothetical protein SA339_13345 [Methanomassiliicoccus sp.]|nr:hypothetical protein [Methanomassiliicoccus sp.]